MKYVLIERSSTDEREYAELQSDICTLDKIDSPYVLKIHRYTYDMAISSQCSLNRYKKIYKLSFLTDFFTTSLQLWIEKRRLSLDTHNSKLC